MKETQSEIQRKDIQNLAATGYDVDYLKIWTKRLGLDTLWKAFMNDTSPEIQQKISEMMLTLSGEERFIRGTRMFEAAREIVLASFPANLSRSRLFERFYSFPLPKNS